MRGVDGIRRSKRELWLAVLVSSLLHLTGIFFVGSLWREAQEAEAFRARLTFKARFEPRRISAARPREILRPNLDFLTTPAKAADSEALTRLVRPPPVAVPEPTSSLRQSGIGSKTDTLDFEQVEMVQPSEIEWTGVQEREESLDLLRLEDIRRAGDLRALIVEHPRSRRHVTGFLSLRQLRVYGAGSFPQPGSGEDQPGSLEALSRYMRDHTKLMVEIGPGTARSFASMELLEDPIHFLIENAGTPAYLHNELVHFDDEEKRQLSRYLREGGFLFIEGQGRKLGYAYLTAMVEALRDILQGDGFLYPLPVSHPIYHSFFEFDSGFPPEEIALKARVIQDSSWYYPRLPPAEAPVGLWGLELNGEVAAVISDLGLFANWRSDEESPPNEGEADESETNVPSATGTEPALQAGTNILVYALTRSEGLTAKRGPSPWEQIWKSDLPTAGDEAGVPDASVNDRMFPGNILEVEGLESLDASLGLLRSPLGSTVDAGTASLSIDGERHVIDPGANGMIVYNLRPGFHDLEIVFGDKVRKLEVSVTGGMVKTLTFGLQQLFLFDRLQVHEQEELVDINQWLDSFSSLAIEERFATTSHGLE